jgi:hypothetical protein
MKGGYEVVALEVLFGLFGLVVAVGGIVVAVLGVSHGRLGLSPDGLWVVVWIAEGAGIFIVGLVLLWCGWVLRMLADNNERQAQCVAWLERHGTLLGRCVEALERRNPAPAAPGLGLDPSGLPVAKVTKPQPPPR